MTPYNFIPMGESRPSRTLLIKDQDYHCKYSRWVLSRAMGRNARFRSDNKAINIAFSEGNQWILDEDTESFLMDQNENPRGRIKVVRNLIRPAVQQLLGNVMSSDFTFRAKCVSPGVEVRREEGLNKMLFLSDISERLQSPDLKAGMIGAAGLGRTQAETEEVYSKGFVDEYAEMINNIIRDIESTVDIEVFKLLATNDFCLSGMGVLRPYAANGKMWLEWIPSELFFFDESAKRPDLKDAQFMGDYKEMSVPEIAERYQPAAEHVKTLEEYLKAERSRQQNRTANNNVDLIQVFKVYWRDFCRKEFGWVMDKHGNETFVELGDEHEESDLVIPSNETEADKLDQNKKMIRWADEVRYCIFIPKELIGSKTSSKKISDIVLEYGVDKYQERIPLHPDSCLFPYKAFCWSYNNGVVRSPIDDIINPQRFINRILSVAEHHLNQAPLPFFAYDKTAVKERGQEEAIIRSASNGTPLGLEGKLIGINNVLTTVKSGVDSGILSLFNVVGESQRGMVSTTGINEQMQGTQGGEELVGTTELLIQRGTLMQQVFFFGVNSLLEQVFQSFATIGKRVYKDDKLRLTRITGDIGSKVFDVMEDIASEDYRVTIDRSVGKGVERKQVDQAAMGFLQMGLITPDQFASVYNSGTMGTLVGFLKENATKQKNQEIASQAEAERMAPQEQEMLREQEQRMLAGQEAEKLREDIHREEDKEHEFQMTALREGMRNKRSIDQKKAEAEIASQSTPS